MSFDRAPWMLTAVFVSLLACGPEEPLPHFYRESFEALCDDGTPCGWTRVNGAADQALWVETVHPGEHGLALVGEVIARGPMTEPGSRAVFGDSLAMQLAARCDEGSTLVFDVLFADDLGVLRASARADAAPARDWEETLLVPLALETGSSSVVASIAGITITKTGSGSCEISEIVIDDGGFRRGCE